MRHYRLVFLWMMLGYFAGRAHGDFGYWGSTAFWIIGFLTWQALEYRATRQTHQAGDEK